MQPHIMIGLVDTRPSKKRWKCYDMYLHSYRHLKFHRYICVGRGLGENLNLIYLYENASELKQLCKNGYMPFVHCTSRPRAGDLLKTG